MALDPIASARIELDLNDEEVLRGLDRVEREYQRTLRDIDRMEASATVDLNTDALEDSIRNVKREMKRLDGQKAEGTLELNTKEFEKEMARLQKQLRVLN